MLGKRPRPLLRTSSRPQLPPCPGHGCPDQYPDDCSTLTPGLESSLPPPLLPLPSTPSIPPPSSVSSKPKFLSPAFGAPAPQHVVIGFNVAAVNCKHGDACDSPRSVLDPVDSSSSSSAAHGFGMAKVGSQEKQGAKSPRSALEGLLASPRSPWGRNANQGVGLAIVAAIKAEEEEAKGRTADASACNPGQQAVAALKCGEGVEQFPSRSQPITIMNPKPIPQKQKQCAILLENDTDDEDEEDIEAEADSAALLRSRNGCQSLSSSINRCLEPRHQEAEVRQSIFCAASPVSSLCGEAGFPGADFLHSCFLCRRVLAQGKDIYMYRGDRAFCSLECRYQQIVLDERKDRCAGAVNCYAGPSSQHNRLQAAVATAAAA